MKKLVLKNNKEKSFLEHLIISTDIYDYPKAKNGKEFCYLMIYRNHERSRGLKDLNAEVGDNLLLLINKDARIAYLNRLVQKIGVTKSIQQQRIELLEYEKKEEYEFLFHNSSLSQINFSVPRKTIIHNLKSGLAYLHFFEIFVQKQIQIELPNQTNEVEKLKDIFKENHFDKCLLIMKHLEIIKNNNKNILTPRTGYKLFALIDAINNVTSNKKILNRTFASDELVSIFNIYLGTKYVKHNRPTKREKVEGKGKHYSQTLIEAKGYLKTI